MVLLYMAWNLFIDDLVNPVNEETGRPFRDPLLIDPSRRYIKASSIDEAIELINKLGCPDFISFDHDLGTDQFGKIRETPELAKWLIKQDLDFPGFIPITFNYQVHSKNPLAEKNLSILRNYLRQR